jgi:hypothetical protein
VRLRDQALKHRLVRDGGDADALIRIDERVVDVRELAVLDLVDIARPGGLVADDLELGGGGRGERHRHGEREQSFGVHPQSPGKERLS